MRNEARPATVSATTHEHNRDIALAVSGWHRLKIEPVFLVNGQRIDPPFKPNKLNDPVAIQSAIEAFPKKLDLGLITGPQTGLLALSIYTSGPETGLFALNEDGISCIHCDTLMRHEIRWFGETLDCFHTALFHVEKELFFETELAAYPGVCSRSSGEVVSIPPKVTVINLELGLTCETTYESKSIPAPTLITSLPEELKRELRESERLKLKKARSTS